MWQIPRILRGNFLGVDVPFLPMEKVWIIYDTKLIGMTWFFFFCKEAIFGETTFKGRFRNQINSFRFSACDVTITQFHTRWKIGVVSATIKQDAKSLLVPAISIDRYDNTSIL